VAGSQTLTVVIRGMALGQVGRSNAGWLLSREFLVAACNGLALALLLGMAVSWVFCDFTLAMVIGAAMLINLITAAVAGTLLPIVLRALRVDPALASGMLLMTITDVVGFFSFLGLATYFYA